MAKLYELSKDAMNLFHISKCINEKGEYVDNSTGELVDKGTLELLEKALFKELKNKGAGLIKADINIKADIDTIDAEIERLTKIKSSLMKQQNNFHNYIMVNMLKIGEKKIESSMGKITVGTSTVTEIYDPSVVPREYKKTQTKIVETISKTDLKKALKDGELIPGARLKINHKLTIK